MKIYRNSQQIYDLPIDGKTTIKRRLMVENSLNLSITVPKSAPLDLRIGDYVIEADERYELSENPQYSLSGGVYSYSALCIGNLHRLEHWQMPDGGLDDFYFFGTLANQIAYVVDNLNAITAPTGDSGWSYEILNPEIIDATPRNVNYASLTILGAAQKIAQEFGVEFNLTSKKFIFAVQIKRATALSFAVGQGKGLYKISRERLTDAKIATRLYGYGGKTNVEFEHRLKFDDGSFVEKNIDRYGLREDRVVFDNIYPRRNGSITVDAVQKSEGSAYWRVSDATLDFDLTVQIVEGAKIVFNSGECAGLEFEISSYDHATKTVTFKEYTDNSSGVTYTAPNANRRPKWNDDYVFTGILMPESYITAAKAELKAATQTEIDRLSVPQHPYSVDCDPRYFKMLNFTPRCGDLCHLNDQNSGLDAEVRIVGIEYSPAEPLALKLTLSDKVPIPVSALIKREVKQTAHKVEVVDRRQEFNARKNAKALNELAGYLLDPDGNFDEELITAKLIRARQYEGGNPSQDLALFGINIVPSAGGLAVSGGSLRHNTYEVSGVGSTWALPSAEFTDLEPDTAYYLYAKCSAMVLEATFCIATTEPAVDDAEQFYCFNIGVLYRTRTDDADGLTRDFVPTYGMFRQVGGRIIGSMISGLDGFNTWDLDGGDFRVGSDASFIEFWDGRVRIRGASLEVCSGGTPGPKGDSILPIFQWAPTKPTTPADGCIATPPADWSFDSDPYLLLTDSSGYILTDNGGVALITPVDAHCRLWVSYGYISGVDGSVVGAWSEPVMQSGTDGKDGVPGKDVDPAVLADLQATAKAIKDNFTQIDGGLVLTTMIKLRDGQNECGGINGVVATNDQYNPLLWSGKYADAVAGTDRVIIWHNGQAKLGDMWIDSNGNLVIKEGGQARVQVSKNKIMTVDDLSGQGASGQTPEYVNGNLPNGTTILTSHTLTVSHNNSTLTIAGTISVSAHISLQNQATDGASAQMAAWLINANGNNVAMLGEISVSAGGIDLEGNPILGGSKTLSIADTMIVAEGSYRLKFVCNSYASGYTAGASCSVRAAKLSYAFVKDINRIQLGINGLCVARDSDNFMRMGFDTNAQGATTFNLTAKGNFDMPGVLAKARVDANRNIYKSWGKSITKVEVTTVDGANRRIYHKVGHDQYTAICTPYGRGSIVEVIREDADSVYVYAVGAFNIELVGDNK